MTHSRNGETESDLYADTNVPEELKSIMEKYRKKEKLYISEKHALAEWTTKKIMTMREFCRFNSMSGRSYMKEKYYEKNEIEKENEPLNKITYEFFSTTTIVPEIVNIINEYTNETYPKFKK